MADGQTKQGSNGLGLILMVGCCGQAVNFTAFHSEYRGQKTLHDESNFPLASLKVIVKSFLKIMYSHILPTNEVKR